MDEALIRACQYIADCIGSCPLDNLEYDIDCENRCSANMEHWTCWYEYFRVQTN